MAVAPLNIMVVDDEPNICRVVHDYLTEKGYRVHIAASGKAALAVLQKEPIQLVVLDLMLPDMPGEEICRKIRRNSRIPILMLTAKVAEAEMLAGLELGADDYVTKPFSLKILHARVAALLRRSSSDIQPLFDSISYHEGDLVIDVARQEVLKQNRPADLTVTEFRLLSVFIKHPGRIYTRDELIALVLGLDYDGFDRTIDTHIKNLRHKIETNPRQPVYIQTVHGLGYKFTGN